MIDQAQNLRKSVLAAKEDKNAKVLSIASGKGGVGKSNIALNLSLSLIQYNKKVLLIDLDVGMANIDILLGKKPAYNITNMIEEKLSIWEIIQTTEEKLAFIAGGSGLTQLFELTEESFDFFLNELEKVIAYYDFIIFDIGAGVSKDRIKFILASNEALIITTTEPTSITDAYSMIKYLNLCNKDLSIHLIINRCISKKEGLDAANRLIRVASTFLQKTLYVRGYIPDDPKVSLAVKSERPLLLYAPNAKASKAISKLAVTYIKEG